MFKLTSICVLLVLITSCGSMSDARILGKGKGKYIAISTQDAKNEALEDAMDGANYFCKKRKKIARLLKKKVKHMGTFDEKTSGYVKAGSKVAEALGKFDAADVGDAATDDSKYKATILFSCQ